MESRFIAAYLLPLSTCMICNFLTTWVYRPDLPGMGLMGGTRLLSWLYFRGYRGKMDGSVKGLFTLRGKMNIAQNCGAL